MNAGMPGTGLGGLFYVLLGLAMPILELVRTAQGRSSPERWRLAATQAAISLGIVGATAGVVLVASRLVPGGGELGALTLLAPVVALGVLVTLTAVVALWGAWARRRPEGASATIGA